MANKKGKQESPIIMIDREKKIMKVKVRESGNSGRIVVPVEWVGEVAKVEIIEDGPVKEKGKKK